MRMCSQLLQSSVHLPLTALSSPGATLEAALPQVLLEILMVHGSVRLRFTLRLHKRTRWEDSEDWTAEIHVGSVITDMLKHEHAVLWTKTEALCSRYTRPHQHLYVTPWESNQTQPENEGRSPCSRPWGCRARGSEVWDTRSWRGLALWRNGTFGGRAPRRTRSGRLWRFACLGWMGQSGSWGGSPSPGPPGVGLALPGTKTNTFRAQGWITYREVFN